MGKRDAQSGRQAVAEAGAATAAEGPLRPPVPESAGPALGGTVGEQPVLALDRLPYLGSENRWRQRPPGTLEAHHVPCLGAESRVTSGDPIRTSRPVSRTPSPGESVLD